MGNTVNTNPQALSNPVVAQTASLHPHQRSKVLDAIGAAATSLADASQTLNKQVRKIESNINQTLSKVNNYSGPIDPATYQWVRTHFSNPSIGVGVYNIKASTSKLTQSIQNSMNASLQSIHKNIQPYSSFVGNTLGTLTGVARDPLGAIQDLPTALNNMLQKRSPKMAAQFSATMRKLKLDQLGRAASHLVDSLKAMASIAQNAFTIAFGFLNDIYVGIREIMNALNDLVNDLFQMVQQYMQSILNMLLPGLTDFLNALTDLASQVSGIVGVFGNVGNIASVTNAFASYSTQISGYISNPMNLAMSVMPSSSRAWLNNILSPATFINSNLPPQVTNAFLALQGASTLGLNSNTGYAVGQAFSNFNLQTASVVLGSFGAQLSLLAPILGINLPSQTQSFTQLPRMLAGGYSYTPNGTPINNNRGPILVNVVP